MVGGMVEGGTVKKTGSIPPDAGMIDAGGMVADAGTVKKEAR